MKRIVITGPESCGKTTLATQLAKHFKAPLVKEHARDFLAERNGKYSEKDLLTIAKEQIEVEDAIIQNFNQEYLIIDTDLITIKIWSKEKYSVCNSWISDQIVKREYDLYLLCKPDIPWSFDPLRENARDRPRLFKLYQSELYQHKKSFEVVSGIGEDRFSNALKIIENHFKS